MSDDDHGGGRSETPVSPPVALDYQVVLAGVIEQAEHDPSRLRALVYELARINLKREVFASYPTIKRAGAEWQMAELERAIERVEADAEAKAVAMAMDFHRPAAIEPPVPIHDVPTVIAPELPPQLSVDNRVDVSLEPVEHHWEPVEHQPPRKEAGHGTSRNSAILQFAGSSAIGILLFAFLTGQISFNLFTSPKPAPETAPIVTQPGLASRQEDPPPPVSAPPSVSPYPFPLPTAYGVYIVSDGKLSELQTLPIRIPDARVQMSAEINTPSTTTVSGENIMFVVFRRELLYGAPQKAQVRVVAQLKRETTFKGGVATAATIDGAWRIRSHAYDFKVSPIEGRQEIITIKPEVDTVLPPGRYALALNGVGYDFSVAGTSTTAAQCLERFEAVNGPVYAECKTP